MVISAILGIDACWRPVSDTKFPAFKLQLGLRSFLSSTSVKSFANRNAWRQQY